MEKESGRRGGGVVELRRVKVGYSEHGMFARCGWTVF